MASETISERLTVIQTRLRQQVDAQLNTAEFVRDPVEEEEKMVAQEKFGDSLRSSTIQHEEEEDKFVDQIDSVSKKGRKTMQAP